MRLPLDDLLAYAERHLHAVAGPPCLARAFALPEEALRRAFRRRTGVPLGRYLRECRVERARWLLARTALRAGEVCRLVGWREDAGARAFRAATGVSMGEYRRAVRGQDR